MPHIQPEASKVVLTPIDASQLHSLGSVIAAEEIRLTRDEKRELLDTTLQYGGDVTIEYNIDGIRAKVKYRVSYLEPRSAYVGRRTTVIIEGESDDVKREVALRQRASLSLLGLDIGGMMRPKSEGENYDPQNSWDISKHVYKKPKRIHPATTIIPDEPKIERISDISVDYNSDGDLGVILEFKGLNFLEGTFTKNGNYDGQNGHVYSTPVSYRNKKAFLLLSTIGDILESEVVPQKEGIDQLFSDEIHIPELTSVYDASSMGAALTNGIIVISYKRINQR